MFHLTPNTPIAKGFPERTEVDRFLSRLTSMAIESEHFERADIFTLFITTRILDFLKSFAIAQDTALSEPLASDGIDQAQTRGLVILRRLLDEQVLYADLGDRHVHVDHFKFELFQKVFQEISHIGCQNGRKIKIDFSTIAGKPPETAPDYWRNPSVCHSREIQ